MLGHSRRHNPYVGGAVETDVAAQRTQIAGIWFEREHVPSGTYKTRQKEAEIPHVCAEVISGRALHNELLHHRNHVALVGSEREREPGEGRCQHISAPEWAAQYPEAA